MPNDRLAELRRLLDLAPSSGPNAHAWNRTALRVAPDLLAVAEAAQAYRDAMTRPENAPVRQVAQFNFFAALDALGKPKEGE